MTQPREGEGVRDWSGDVASANDLEEVRTWVVWGFGPPDDRAADQDRTTRPGEPGNDVARRIAGATDSEWGESEDPNRWVVLLEADEDVVDEWVLEDESVRGYAPYLMRREDAGAEPEIQPGLLRGDVVRRRKPKRFDAARPS